jgi:hypothetical protein
MKKSGGEDAENWIALAASEIGTSHKRKHLPCQDASHVTVARGGLVVGAIADGIGSAVHSDVGSKLAVETASAYLLERAAELLARRGKTAREHCLGALAKAAEALRSCAARHKCSPDDYGCTLILVLAAPDWLAALSVGDGFVVWRDAGSDAHEVLIPPDKSEFVNYTSSITSSDTQETLRFEFCHAAPAFVLASSDGLLYLVLESETWKPHPPFFNFIESYIARDEVTNDKLRKLLADPQINALTDDDKTLLLACSREHMQIEPKHKIVAAKSARDRSADD